MNTTSQQALLSPAPATARRYLTRVTTMALFWFGLNGTDWSSWIVGGPAVLISAWVSLKLLPTTSVRWSARGAARFIVYFLKESLRGAWDVARRVFSPGLPVSPGILRYRFHLPEGGALLFFCGVVSLLPGTAVIAIEQGHVSIHVLDLSPQVEDELRELEGRVAAVFGLGPTEFKEATS